MRVAILGSDMERAAMLRNMVAEAIGGEIAVGVHTAQLPADVTFDLLILDVPVTADPIDSFAQVVSLRARHRVLFAPRCDLDLAKLGLITRTISLAEAIPVAQQLLDGQVRGRVVVQVAP